MGDARTDPAEGDNSIALRPAVFDTVKPVIESGSNIKQK